MGLLYESEYMRICYKLLHRISGGVKMFLNVTMTLIDKPFILHQVAAFAQEMELSLHDCHAMGPVLLCWRTKLGSDGVAFKIVDHIDKPGCLKLVMFSMRQLNVMVVQKIGLPILRIIKSQTKLFLFNLDMIKDILLWIFLLSRFQALQDSPWINGEFVIILILINKATIFLS